jgi:hypothetical protein
MNKGIPASRFPRIVKVDKYSPIRLVATTADQMSVDKEWKGL